MKRIIISLIIFLFLGFEDIKEININAIGDCTLGNYYGQDYKYSFDYIFDTNKDYSYFFKNVRGLFKKDDLTIANLEGPLTNSRDLKIKNASISYNFKGKKEYAKILKEGYVDVVNLSNNHIYDYGKKGYEDTLAALKSNGLDWYGNGRILIKNVKGIRIGILGYKLFGLEKLNVKSYKAYLLKEVQRVRKNCDYLIVTFHWGEENEYFPNKIQKEIAHFLMDNGVDLILGHHPHVLQGIENYKGKYIAYSLGNFCYGGNKKPRDFDTVILNIKIKFSSQNKTLGTEINIIPCSISSTKNINDYCPKILKGQEKNRVLNKIKSLSKDLGEY